MATIKTQGNADENLIGYDERRERGAANGGGRIGHDSS